MSAAGVLSATVNKLQYDACARAPQMHSDTAGSLMWALNASSSVRMPAPAVNAWWSIKERGGDATLRNRSTHVCRSMQQLRQRLASTCDDGLRGVVSLQRRYNERHGARRHDRGAVLELRRHVCQQAARPQHNGLAAGVSRQRSHNVRNATSCYNCVYSVCSRGDRAQCTACPPHDRRQLRERAQGCNGSAGDDSPTD